MATWRSNTFRSAKDMIEFLNGAIQFPANLNKGLDLDGLTLVIDKDGNGNRTVTFTPKGSLWSAEEIRTAIEATHADLVGAVSVHQGAVGSLHHGRGQVYLKLGKNDGSVYTIQTTGTANALFGLSTSAATVGTPYTNSEVEVFRNVGDQNPWIVFTYK